MGAETVSVVVPAYESEGTIGRAVDSALAQTLDDVAVIVVDDGSTDDTAAIVEGYDDPRITLCRHEENRGGAAARNTGIDRADGEFVAFLDADDEWEPEKLERQVACLRERSEEWIAAYCGYEKHPANRVVQLKKAIGTYLGQEFEGKEGGEELIEDVLLGQFALGGASTLLVEADVAEAVGGFDEAFPRHQDWEFLVRVLERGKLACVEDPLVVKYQGHNTNAEETLAAKRVFFESFAEEIDALEREGHDVVEQHLFELSRQYFVEGRFRSGVHYLRRSNPRRNVRLMPLLFSMGIGLTARVLPTSGGLATPT